jgi:hypothetical protein
MYDLVVERLLFGVLSLACLVELISDGWKSNSSDPCTSDTVLVIPALKLDQLPRIQRKMVVEGARPAPSIRFPNPSPTRSYLPFGMAVWRNGVRYEGALHVTEETKMISLRFAQHLY